MRKNYFYLVLAIVCSINVMAQNIPSYVPKDGLVGFWPFNGNANDESGNGNHGTVNGATLTADRNGVENSAYSFDGVKNDIRVTSNKTLNLNFDCTFSAWIKLTEKNTGEKTIISKFRNYDDAYAIRITNMNPGIQFADAPTKWTLNNSSKSIDIDKWVNIIITKKYTDSLIKIFIDGILTNQIKNSQSIATSNADLMFGNFDGNNWNSGIFFKGLMDDIAIYNRALSEQEIAKLYAGCTKETATSSNFNTLMYTTNAPVNLIASPTGGTFSGNGVTNNAFNPSKAKLGKNQVKYNFKNTTGCADSTNFTMILVDTLGNKCSTYDTLKIKVKLTTGIKAGQQTSMNVYPNPTSDKLIIETNDIQALSGYKYKIVDLQGKEVYNALATSAKTEISLKSIGAKGMYILHIVDEKGVSIENKKIVLE